VECRNLRQLNDFVEELVWMNALRHG